MAYCRWSSVTEDGKQSNVYCYEAVDDNLYYIHIIGDNTHIASTAGDAAKKLIELKKSGHNVPQYAIDALIEDDKIDD